VKERDGTEEARPVCEQGISRMQGRNSRALFHAVRICQPGNREHRKHVHIFMLAAVACGIAAATQCYPANKEQPHEPEYLHSVVVLPWEQSDLWNALVHGCLAAGVPLCTETAPGDEKVFESSVETNPVKVLFIDDLVARLNRAGCLCDARETYLYVRGPSVRNIQKNPLDKKVRAFAFSGNHSELKDAIGQLILPEALVLGMRPKGYRGDQRYEVQIPREVSVRDILFELASAHSTGWGLQLGYHEGTQKPTMTAFLSLSEPEDSWVSPLKPDEQAVNASIEKAQERPGLEARRALRVLVWAQDPKVIPALLKGAQLNPECSQHVVLGLGKFFDNEQALGGILVLAESGGPATLQAAIRVFKGHNAAPPLSLCKAALNSKDLAKVYVMLRYLVEDGQTEHITLVRPLAEHENPDIRGLARKFLGRLGK